MKIKPHSTNMTSRSPMYIYATEMVSSYYSFLKLKDKKILSIVGSGDQIINAYYYGAKEVVGFDINIRAEQILDLKASALKSLNYFEYLKFFGEEMGRGTLDIFLYNRIRNNLKLKTRNFFDKLYKEFNNNGSRLIKSEYFRERSMINAGAKDINIYLKNRNNYLKCQKILKNVDTKFIELDINDIASCKKIEGDFDIINLSNVLNYLTANTEEKDFLKVLSAIARKVSRRLNNCGLFFYYSYTQSLYPALKRAVPPASRIDLIKEICLMANLEVSFKNIKGVDLKNKDRINIFKIKSK